MAHVERGERSGTIDEMIRHSVTKLAHVHFVANEEARGRLLQMGEHPTGFRHRFARTSTLCFPLTCQAWTPYASGTTFIFRTTRWPCTTR